MKEREIQILKNSIISGSKESTTVSLLKTQKRNLFELCGEMPIKQSIELLSKDKMAKNGQNYSKN